MTALASPRVASSGRRGAPRSALLCSLLACTSLTCRKHEAPHPLDAAPPVDAAPLIDTPPTPPPIDAAARPASTPTRLVASGDSTCAVMSDLTLRCWGGNAHGQLGNGDTTDAPSPVTPPIRAVVDLQLADATACALLDDASVACWGQIAWHGRAEDVLRPTGVLGVIGVKQIFVLPGRACARVANDSLVCWGNIDARGHFTAGAHRVPTPVVGLDHVAGLTPDGAFSDDGRMWRWAGDGVPKRIDLAGVQEIAAREGTVCGRLEGGRVMCVDSGRCGPPSAPPPSAPPHSTPPHSTPPPPAKPPTTATKLPSQSSRPTSPHGEPSKPNATSSAASAAKSATSGAGKSATSGAGKSATSAAGKSATSAAGAAKSDAARKPTTAAAKSAAASGQPSQPAGEPAQPLGFPAARQLVFDLGFCVVTTSGRLQCGDGCRKLQPVALERITTIVGRCALLKAGTVSCFDGAKFVAVAGLQRATALAVGRAHACALTGGAIACWGDRDHGQLGDFAIAP